MATDALGPVAFEGQRQAEADQWSNQLNQMSMGLKGAQTREADSLSEEHQTETAIKQLTLKQNQTLQQLQEQRLKAQANGQKPPPIDPSQIPDGIPDPAIGFAEDYATDLMKAGMVKEGIEVADKANLMRERNAQLERAKAQASEAKTKERINKLKAADQMLSGATDEQSWRQANLQYQAAFGEASPFAQLPYNPDFVKHIKDQLLTQMQKQELAIKEQDERRKQSATASGNRKRALETDMDFLQRKASVVAKARADARSPSIVPPAGELKAASDLIRKNYPVLDNKDSPDLGVYSRELAERTRSLLASRPALTGSEASHQAFQAMEKDGVFRSAKSKSGGKTPQSAVKLPEKGAKLQPGTWYTDGKAAKQWDGKGWSSAPSGGSSSGGSSSSEDDEEDDKDDDD